jgi:hypothetical protein
MAQKHETEMLLKTLKEHGIIPVDAHCSGDPSEPIDPTWEGMSEVEDACLWVRFGEDSDGQEAPRTWMRLIYGNGPGELVADWGIPRGEKFCAAIEAACNAHFNLFNE